MITAIIHISKLFEQSSHQYVIIMISDVVTVQSSRVKTQIIKFKVQSSKDKVPRIKKQSNKLACYSVFMIL